MTSQNLSERTSFIIFFCNEYHYQLLSKVCTGRIIFVRTGCAAEVEGTKGGKWNQIGVISIWLCVGQVLHKACQGVLSATQNLDICVLMVITVHYWRDIVPAITIFTVDHLRPPFIHYYELLLQ